MSTRQPLFSLAIDRDPEAYLEVHSKLDESVSEALLSTRDKDVRDKARDVVARDVAPHTAEIDSTHAFAEKGFQALAKAGLVGLIFPERLGGTGDSHVAYAAAMEEITAGDAATSLIFMTQTHAAYPILLAGSDELAAEYIPPILEGTHYGSIAITEPDAGSDAAAISTRAKALPDGDAYLISGSKTFITTGDRADTIVCFATTDPREGRKGITAFVVESDSEGFTTGRPFDKMGMHGSSTAELFLTDVRVPASNRLGSEGTGWNLLMASVTKSRISAAAQGVGIARNVYARTILALQQIYGTRLPDDVAFALADIRSELLRGRLLLFATAREVDEAENPSPAHIGIMKQVCTDLGWNVSVAATKLLGAYGDLVELGVERGLRDSKITQIYDGTNEVQRLLIGRDTGKRFEEFA
jgi:alkylation response protein AidB-like acyl-CoA dehydrogenase